MPNLEWEDLFIAQGHRLIAGIDEVGRGALAGPVVAAAVILHPDDIPEGIDDSKKLSRPRRESLAREIRQRALAVAVARVEPAEIDQINILQATLKAMQQAVATLSPGPDALLIDALTLRDVTVPQQGIIGGDGKSLSIAAASIVAKVARDSVMCDYESAYPGYGFDRHVGYGTRTHWEALRRLGPCPIHRLTFRGVVNTTNADNQLIDKQS